MCGNTYQMGMYLWLKVLSLICGKNTGCPSDLDPISTAEIFLNGIFKNRSQGWF